MRSVQTVGSTQFHLEKGNPTCVAVTGTGVGVGSIDPFLRIHLPAPLCSAGISRFTARMGALTSRRVRFFVLLIATNERRILFAARSLCFCV